MFKMLIPTREIFPFPLRKKKTPKDKAKDSTGGNICFDRRSPWIRPEEYFFSTGGVYRFLLLKPKILPEGFLYI